MKYQVGEYVKIKENAKDIYAPSVCFASPGMDKFCGNVYQIRKYYSKECYFLEDVKSTDDTVNGDGYWIWAEEWLEPVGEDYSDIENDEIMNLFT